MAPDNIILFDSQNKLGTVIRAARQRQRLSPQWLALQLHMDSSTLCRLERGATQTIHLTTVVEISRTLKSPLVLKTAVQMIQQTLSDLPEDGNRAA